MIYIDKDISLLRDEIIEVRRLLHQIPEMGFEEYKTRNFIVEKLIEYELDVYKGIAKTGVIGYLKGKKGDRTLAFRADMDALTVNEKTLLPYQSLHPGIMHACGHDAHMAIVLGLAKFLSMQRNNLKDNIVFIFQPAEEGPGGAQPMIEEGVIEKFKIDKVIGLHVFPEVEEGKIGCRYGAMMAQTGEFDVSIQGQSGHGAMPHNAKDSIVIASYLITAYQSIISRNVPPIEGAVLTIGKMRAGEIRNVIAGGAILEGTIRTFSEKVYKRIKAKMTDIAKGLATAYDCSIDIVFRDMYPAVINDQNMVNYLVDAVGQENIDFVEPQMIAEDFSYFQKKVPGLFFFLGVRNKTKGHIYPLHHCCFNFNEEILLTGVQVYVNLIKEMKGLSC